MFSYSLRRVGWLSMSTCKVKMYPYELPWREEKGKHKGHDSQKLMNEGVITNTFMSRINVPDGKT